MRKSKVLSFVLVAALAVTAIPINAFGTVNDEKNKLSDLQNQKYLTIIQLEKVLKK